MDIKRPLHANIPITANKAGLDGLHLKLGQLLDAKLIETQSILDTLKLKIADTTITVQADRPLNLQNGQSMQLQVVKLLPALEFKLIQPTLPQPPSLMDIKPPLNTNIPITVNKAGLDGLHLKLGQLLDAKLIETHSILDTLKLKIADTTITVQADRPLNLQNGQSMQLQVVKLLPALEFKLTQPTLTASPSLTHTQPKDGLILRLIDQTPPSSAPTANTVLSDLQARQQLQATIVKITGNQITLQLSPHSQNNAAPQTATAVATTRNQISVTLDIKQLISLNPANSSTTPSQLTSLTEGSQITLQVVRPGDSPILAVLSTTTDTEQQIIQALKQLLPIQASPAPLLNQLQQALPHLQADATVAETLKNLAQQILRGIPPSPLLTEPTRLKQAVNESGLFLESKLAELLLGKPTESLQGDFKLKLSKLIQLLNQELATKTDSETLKESLQKAQSALAKLTLDQLNSLPKDDSPKQDWTLELPFFHNNTAETVKIEIERNKAHNDDKDEARQNWSVSITITPPNLATIHCKISCYDGSINTRFWSEASDTVEKINAHLDYLKQQLEQKGLTTGFMEAHQGLPAQTDNNKRPMPHLLSEKA